MFRDAEGTLHYIMDDSGKNGAAESWIVSYDVRLEDGHVYCTGLAMEHGVADNEGNHVTYTNGAGKEISRAQYLAAVDETFAESTELVGIIDWRELEEIAGADASEIYKIMSGIRSGIFRGNTSMETPSQS